MTNICQKLNENDIENNRQMPKYGKQEQSRQETHLLSNSNPYRSLFVTMTMKPIKNFLINIIVNGAVLYAIVHYVPELGFKIQTIYKDVYIIFGILGLVFWLINSVLKKILMVMTLPVRMLTLGISSLLINIVVLYIFEQTMNYLDLGITVTLGTITQTLILSVILSAIYFLIKKII